MLYCATTKTGAYKEVLADFRPSAKAYRIAEGESIMAQGSMPRSWRDARALAEFSLEDPLPFVDIERDSTLTHLTAAMAEQLDELGVRALDVSFVRGPNRLLTRSIAKWLYTLRRRRRGAAVRWHPLSVAVPEPRVLGSVQRQHHRHRANRTDPAFGRRADKRQPRVWHHAALTPTR
ncbi:hypothetical protein [Cryobacterium sp. Hz7]|uniref:hypothetical protein n=1 Tax=Cryobacterium sp. Hz7 TaxID=1259166 RepID=UPI0035184F4F